MPSSCERFFACLAAPMGIEGRGEDGRDAQSALGGDGLLFRRSGLASIPSSESGTRVSSLGRGLAHRRRCRPGSKSGQGGQVEVWSSTSRSRRAPSFVPALSPPTSTLPASCPVHHVRQAPRRPPSGPAEPAQAAEEVRCPPGSRRRCARANQPWADLSACSSSRLDQRCRRESSCLPAVPLCRSAS